MDNLPSLPLPVVGDRVEVLWEGRMYAAEVITCHSTGEYDVVYEKGGAEGTFVTRDKQQLLPRAGGGGGRGVGGGRQRCKRSQLIRRRGGGA